MSVLFAELSLHRVKLVTAERGVSIQPDDKTIRLIFTGEDGGKYEEIRLLVFGLPDDVADRMMLINAPAAPDEESGE